MRKHRCPTFGKGLSYALVALLVIGILTPPVRLAPRQAEAQARVKTVLAFPAADESEKQNLAEAASRLTSALALAGAEVPEIDLEVFSQTSPSVRRGLQDGSLRKADVEAPKDAAVALVIGRAFRVDSVVLLGVQSLTVGGQPRQAELSVVGTEYLVAPNIDAETGQVVAEPKGTTFGVSGKTKLRGKVPDDTELTRLACMDAAYNILSVLAGKTAETFVAKGARPHKKSDLFRWVAVGLIVTALAIVATRGGGEGHGQVSDLLPTRITAKVESNAIRISWVPPTTTRKTIFRYEVQKSVDGSAFQRVDAGQLGATATQFNDFGVSSGHAYVYQIRVLYTDGTITQWVPRETLQIQVP
jgi:hypothetical protein